MDWRRWCLLVFSLLIAGCTADKPASEPEGSTASVAEDVQSSTEPDRPNVRKPFFAGFARANQALNRGNQGLNRPLSLDPVRPTEASPSPTQASPTPSSPPVNPSPELPVEPTTAAPSRPDPRFQARLRPEDELSDSIQSQVAQSLFTAKLADRTGADHGGRIVRPLLTLPRARSQPKLEAPEQPRFAEPSTDRTLEADPVLFASVPADAELSRYRNRAPQRANPPQEERRLNEEVELDPEEIRYREYLARKERLRKLPVEPARERLVIPLEKPRVAAVETQPLEAAPEPRQEAARKPLTLETDRRPNRLEAARERLRLAELELEKELAGEQFAGGEYGGGKAVQYLTPQEASTRAPTTEVPPPRPSQQRFFGSRVPGAVEVRPSSSLRTVQDKDKVEVGGIQFPKFSKMIKNTRLNLLQVDDTSRAVAPLVEKVLPRTLAAIKPKTETPVSKAPVIQGFRVKGDNTNRIIFLNIADFNLSPGSGSLKLGDSELIPIEGSTGLTGAAGPVTNSGLMNKDAESKMLLTQLQHREDIHTPVRLPALDAARQSLLPAPRSPLPLRIPQFLEQYSRTQSLDQADRSLYLQQLALLPPGSRQQGQQRNQGVADQRGAVERKQPVQFFNKFDEKTKAAFSPELQPEQQLQQPPAALRNQGPERQGSFSSFPVQSGTKLPDRSTLAQLPDPRTLQQLDFVNSPQDETRFNAFLDGVFDKSSVEEVQNRFQPPQQQNRFLPPQQQNRFQPPQQLNQFNRQQQQQQTLDQPQAPGVAEVLRQQAELIRLQLSQSQENLDPQFQQQQQLQQQQQYQPPQQQQYQQPQQQQQYEQPKVPGLEILEQQRQALLAVELAQEPSRQQQQQQYQQPQQYQQQQQYQQPQQQQQQQQNSIPGLDQHARFVAELQAAQNALGALG